MIVLDASAAVLGLLSAADARRVLADEEIAIPHLADAEVAHALRGLERHGELSAAQAAAALATWARLGVRRFRTVAALSRVWELRGNLTAYDATYVALAELLDCPLVTADARLARAPGPRCTITTIKR